MQVSNIQTNITELATYKSVQLTGKGNTWAIMKVTGERMNYVNVRKVSNNPFGGLGKQFNNFDEAQQAYKSPELKSMLLIAETLL